MFKNYVSFVQLLFAAYKTKQGLHGSSTFSFQILCYAVIMTNL